MAQNGGPSLQLSAELDDVSSGAAPRARLKPLLFGVIVVVLAAVVGIGLLREARAPARSGEGRPTLGAPRPALTAAEERYAQVLWPIHTEVKGSAFGMTLVGMKYKLGDLDRADVRDRLAATAELYRGAEGRVRALTPPPSLAAVHADYLDALRLFREATAEMSKVADDGRDEHLVAALPLSQEASRRLRVVGKAIWPGEYVPN